MASLMVLWRELIKLKAGKCRPLHQDIWLQTDWRHTPKSDADNEAP